jgi:excisionase family DNA binding protein
MRHEEEVSVRERTPELKSTAGTARLLDCSVRTIYRLVDRGELQPVRLGRVLRFEVDQIDAYVQRNRQQAP